MEATIGFEGDDSARTNLADTDLDQSHVNELEPRKLASEDVRRIVDSLDISADWKMRLEKVVRLAVRVGGRVIRVGMKILETILDTMKQYPMTSAALIIGGILSLLASTIPVLGLVLAPLLAAVAVTSAGFTFAAEQMLRVKTEFRAFSAT